MAKRSDPRMLKPYIQLGHKSDKGFNTSTVAIRAKCGKGVLSPVLCKDAVNTRRINKETRRVKIQRASFVNAARLVNRDGEVISMKALQ